MISLLAERTWYDAASIVGLQVSGYSQLYDYTVRLQLYRMISENNAHNVPITFEEIVMVIINNITRHVMITALTLI